MQLITIIDLIIFILQFSLFYGILVSPILDNIQLKKIALILLGFIILHFLTRYGKCGFINIERYFLKDKFRDGFLFKLIKPVISYKKNMFYHDFFPLMLIYFFILFTQIFNRSKLFFFD
jgi:hypothetical protein